MAASLAPASADDAKAITALPPAPLANPDRSEKRAEVKRLARLELTAQAANPDRVAVTMSEAETTFRKQVRKMIGDMPAVEISASDLTNLKTVETAAARGKLETLTTARAAIQDPTAQKIADWLKLRAGFGTATAYITFLESDRFWPSRALLRRKMEDIAFTRGGSVAEIKRLFKSQAPLTGAGLAVLASAEMALGNGDEAAKLARQAWTTNAVSNNFETGFLERFGKLLRPEDHVTRVRRLLSKNYTGKKTRNGRAARVRRMLPLMADADQKLATALLSVYLDQKGANKLVSALPKAARNSDAMQRQRAQRDYRAGKYAAAADRIAKVPGGAESAAPDSDWGLRYDIAVKLIDAKDFKRAHAAVRDARPDNINKRKESTFIAGWLALRYLDKPDLALKHFEAMKEAADGPLSKAKVHYWLGRAHAKRGDSKAATAAYREATAFRDTFHGGLARVALSPAERGLTLPMPELPTAVDVEAFKKRNVIRAALIADKAGLSRGRVRGLFGEFTWRVKSPGEIILAAELAEMINDGQIAVRAGKAGVARGFPHYIYSYPIHRLPAFDPLRAPPASELLLGIARQESEFNTRIVSRVGARGVLQVMPITARHVCQNYRVKCEIKRLLTDESYNARIAAAYIAEQSGVVRGNLILTLTSYNAGPGRTRQWIRERGDPRSTAINPLDWVYKLPFEETRLYVQKVMSNIQVYRARLGKSEPIRVDFDMAMAEYRRADAAPETPSTSPSSTSPSTTENAGSK
ncbi:MAG: lytic transglycosylase domain-containing protein [Pseudomonadota bacterium]